MTANFNENSDSIILSDSELRRGFCKALPDSRTARLAVAFWGDGAIENLSLQNCRDIRVVCNLRTGGTNPHEIRKLMKLADVRHSDVLHSKIYLLDHIGYVGSSNASSNGMNVEGEAAEGWTETNIAVVDPSLYQRVAELFEEIFSNAVSVTDDDLTLATQRWSARRRQSHILLPEESPTNETFLSLLEAEPDRLIDRKVYVCAYEEPLSSDAKKKVKAEKAKTGIPLDCFEDWPEERTPGDGGLPRDAKLICFRLGKRGGAYYEGLWHMPEVPLIGKTSYGRLLYCLKIYNIFGCNSLGDLALWRSALKNAQIDWRKDGETSALIEVGQFYRKYVLPNLSVSNI